MIGLGNKSRPLAAYVGLSLSQCALPKNALTPARRRAALGSWFPGIIRAGLHRVPPGIVWDVACAVQAEAVRWQTGDQALSQASSHRQAGGQASSQALAQASSQALAQASSQALAHRQYCHAVRAFAGRFRSCEHLAEEVVTAALVELLRQITAAGVTATGDRVPEAPRAIVPGELMDALHSPVWKKRHRAKWRQYIDCWLQLATAGLNSLVERGIADHWGLAMAGRRAPGLPTLGNLCEREVLSRLGALPSAAPALELASTRQSRGLVRQRFQRGQGLPGIDGLEQSGALERACTWQLAFDRRLLADRIMTRQLTAFRQPRRSSVRQQRVLLLAWLDPTAVDPQGMHGCRQTYLSGKQLAIEVFLSAIVTMREMGLRDLALGLVALPCRKPPGLVTTDDLADFAPEQRDIAGNPYPLMAGLPALASFASRCPHHPSLLSSRALGGVYAGALAAGAQTLAEAIGDAATHWRLRITVILPESETPAGAINRPRSIDAAAARREVEAYTRELIGARVPVLAVHDANGQLTAINATTVDAGNGSEIASSGANGLAQLSLLLACSDSDQGHGVADRAKEAS